MKITKALVLATLVLLALSPRPASAIVLGLDWGLGQSVAHVNYKGHNMDVWAGKMAGYLGGSLGNPKPPADGEFFGYVYCVDLDHTIGLPTEYEVTRETTAALTHGARAAWLYNSYLSSTTDASTAAALQLALWDVVVDNGDGFGSGQFLYTGGLSASTETEATSMLASSLNRASSATYFRPVAGGQAMIGPVPEPGSVLLLGLGLGLSLTGVALRRRR